MNKKEKLTVGVVIARFQVPELHAGHKYLIEEVSLRHKKVLVFLGTRPAQPTKRHPLDYETRKLMVIEKYPDVMVQLLQDRSDNDVWSQSVDEIVGREFPKHKATLYGSRESFIPYYTGNIDCVELPQRGTYNGSVDRKELSHIPLSDQSFRRGVMYVTTRQYLPTAYQTVDAAIVDRYKKQVLLGRKAGEQLFRFVGGFVDPSDKSLEFAVKREVCEEVGSIEIDDLVYLGSEKVDDWRYLNSESGIMTSFFVATYIFGGPHAGDDLEEVKWFKFNKFESYLLPAHRGLGQKLKLHLERRSNHDK